MGVPVRAERGHPCPSGPRAAPKPCHRAQAATTVTAQSRAPPMTPPMDIPTRHGTVPAARGCAAKPSKTGTAGPTATAPRGRRAMSPTWGPAPPSQKRRAGNWRLLDLLRPAPAAAVG